jgi:hypothetical protein
MTHNPELTAYLDEVFAGTYFDRAGNPITWSRYSELWQNTEYRVVRRTPVGEFNVITAWLGSDRGFGYDEVPPKIFGTIVQAGDGFDDRTETFAANEADAITNHENAVAALGAWDRSTTEVSEIPKGLTPGPRARASELTQPKPTRA